MNWLDKYFPRILIGATIVGWIWSVAMTYARVKVMEDKVKSIDDTVIGHVKNNGIHIDPIRDERRLAEIERSVTHIEDKLAENFQKLMEAIMEVKAITKKL